MQLRQASSGWGFALGGLDDRLWGHLGEYLAGGGGAVLTSLPFINVFSVLNAHTYFQSLQQPFRCKKTKGQGSEGPGTA